MRCVGAFLALAAATAAPAFAAQYTLDLKPENTKIEWTLGDVIHTVHGTFALKNGKIDFDTETGAASGQVAVDVASGQSGSGSRDRRMHSTVLESAKYPDAVFIPDRIDGTIAVPGASSVKLHGAFRIHGQAHDVTMNAQTKVESNRIEVTATFEIPYVAWGMKDPGNFMLKVDKTVQLTIHSTGVLSSK